MKVRTENGGDRADSASLQLHAATPLSQADHTMLNKLEWHKVARARSKYSSTMGRLRGRRTRRPIYKLQHDDASILDTQYSGQALCLLATVGDWEFNVFTMDKLTSGRPLFHTGLRMLQDHGLIEHFKLDVVKLMRCITLIEEGYHSSNPYHNAVHATDVGQAMHCYLRQHKVSQYLTPLEKMIGIFAALAHDVEHPGVNNAFLIATSNHLASLYNNVSVLEYHHWRTTMSIFHDSGLFQHLDKDTLDTIEWQMKSLILATDITRQAEFLNKFREVLDNDDLNLKREKDRHFMLQIALKVADISNPGRPWDVSRRWSELVCDEFFKQGDYERKLGLPVTPLNDRHNTTVAKIQSGFMQFVVLPLFNEWRRFNPTELSNKLIHNIKANKAEWDAIILQQTQEAEQQKEDDVIEEEELEDEETCSPTRSSPSPDVVPAPATDIIRLKQKHRRSIPHSSDGESCEASGNEEEDSSSCGGTPDSSPDFSHIMSFMPRRHSLPISSFTPPNSASHTTVLSPFSLLAQRRHSLPVSAIPNVGMDIFEQLSDQLDTVAECSFNDQNEHAGEKISLQSLDPGALPEAKLEASRLTSAHGLENMRSPSSIGANRAADQNTIFSYTNDIAQSSSFSSQSVQQQYKRINLGNNNTSGVRSGISYHHRHVTRDSNGATASTLQTGVSNPAAAVNCNARYSSHSVVVKRERAVSIPTHFRLKSALLELAGSSLASRRVSMGDQPIYLDTTPLLSSPMSGEEYVYTDTNS